MTAIFKIALVGPCVIGEQVGYLIMNDFEEAGLYFDRGYDPSASMFRCGLMTSLSTGFVRFFHGLLGQFHSAFWKRRRKFHFAYFNFIAC